MSERLLENGQVDLSTMVGTLGDPIPRAEYDLSDEEMNQLEAELFAEVSPLIGEHNGIAVVAVGPHSRYAAFGRSSERPHYETDQYDLHKGMVPYEDNSIFLFTLDADSGVIGHVKRIVFADSPEQITETGLTGLEIVDDRIQSEADEHAGLAEVMAYHGISNIASCINVASNHIMKRPGTSGDKPYTLASYKAVYDITVGNSKRSAANSAPTVFAYLNRPAIDSFAKFGLEYELLAGRELHVPNTEYDPSNPTCEQFDKRYIAVCIQETDSNSALFKGLGEMVPATVAPLIPIDK